MNKILLQLRKDIAESRERTRRMENVFKDRIRMDAEAKHGLRQGETEVVCDGKTFLYQGIAASYARIALQEGSEPESLPILGFEKQEDGSWETLRQTIYGWDVKGEQR